MNNKKNTTTSTQVSSLEFELERLKKLVILKDEKIKNLSLEKEKLEKDVRYLGRENCYLKNTILNNNSKIPKMKKINSFLQTAKAENGLYGPILMECPCCKKQVVKGEADTYIAGLHISNQYALNGFYLNRKLCKGCR